MGLAMNFELKKLSLETPNGELLILIFFIIIIFFVYDIYLLYCHFRTCLKFDQCYMLHVCSNMIKTFFKAKSNTDHIIPSLVSLFEL